MPRKWDDDDQGFHPDDPCWYGRIPHGTRQRLRDYVTQRIPAGDFLFAVLTDDLRGAVYAGDLENLAALAAIVAWLYNRAPGLCWGTPERVAEWLADPTPTAMGAGGYEP